MSYQQCIIVGNLGRDPELKYMPSGDAVCKFTVAVSEKWTSKGSGEKQEKTTWFSVSVWGNQAETCAQYLAKGRQVMVIGTVEARAYQNNAGEAAASLDMRARDVRFIGSRDGGGGGGGEYNNEYSGGGAQAGGMDDIPF